MELWLSSGAVSEIRTVGPLEEMELWLSSGAVLKIRTIGNAGGDEAVVVLRCRLKDKNHRQHWRR